MAPLLSPWSTPTVASITHTPPTSLNPPSSPIVPSWNPRRWVCGNAPSTAIDVNNLKKLQATRKLRKAGAKLMALNRLKNMSISK